MAELTLLWLESCSLAVLRVLCDGREYLRLKNNKIYWIPLKKGTTTETLLRTTQCSQSIPQLLSD